MPKDYELYFTVADAIPVVEYIAKAVKILDLIYNFGRESAEQRAIQLLVEHVAVIHADIDDINRRLDVLNQRMVQSENRTRLRLLKEHHIEVQELALRLGRNPDLDELANIADSAALRVTALLDDADLWLWSDIGGKRTPGGDEAVELAEPEFKVLPLPVLATGIAAFALAAALRIAQDPSAHALHSPALARFLAAVSVRLDWVDPDMPPKTLAEQVRASITVRPHALTNHVTNGACVYGLVCVNRIERTRHVVRDVTIVAPAGTPADTLCMAPPNLGQNDESVIEDEYGPVVLLGTLEKMLSRLETTGKLADPPILQFPDFVSSALTLYAVDRAGRLLRFDTKLTNRLSEDVVWKPSLAPLRAGWNGFKAVVAGDWNVLYTVSEDDSVLWNRHDGAADDTAAWSGPTQVAGKSHAVGVFSETVIAGSNGLIYRAVRGSQSSANGIRRTSELLVDRHPGVASGTGTFTGPTVLHGDWPNYATVFGGARGAIYGIDPQGNLFWHQHVDAPSGKGTFHGPVPIGVGWNAFVRTFSAGDGYIFGVFPNGSMRVYHFRDWRDGPAPNTAPRWNGPVDVRGTGWNAFLHFVPVLQSPRPVVK